jgi:hypothetical protein
MDQEHSAEPREEAAARSLRQRSSGHGEHRHSTHSHSTQGQFLLSPRALLCVGAVVWIATVSMSSRGMAETTPWRTVSQARWETSCPACGTVEGIAQMLEPRGARSWRVDVRTSGGWLRPFHSDTALALGQRVMVEGDRLRAAEAPSCR